MEKIDAYGIYSGHRFECLLVSRTKTTLEVQIPGYSKTVKFYQQRNNPGQYVYSSYRIYIN